MFEHQHPYAPYIPEGAIKLIVGTLPPPRFTQKDLKEGDVNFCYGSRDGYLWPVLDRIFDLKLKFETTEEAILQRKKFLKKHKIGICDIVEKAYREKIDATDLGMKDIELRDLVGYIKKHPTVEMLIFTGGNSKNGPEYFFRKHLKEYGLKLEVISDEIPRIHQFEPVKGRLVKTVSLIAPSGSANRAIGSLKEYQALKNKNPKFNTIDFRVLQYANYF